MPKTVLASHIVGERGVNAFENYCNRHQPYIIWRETTKNDFGIDGEVELTTYRNAVATALISQLGFDTSQRCGTSSYFWGDELTLQRREANRTVTATFDPYATLRIGIRRAETGSLETTNLASATE